MDNFLFTISDKKSGGYKKIASLLFMTNAVIFFVLALGTTAVRDKIILFTASVILLGYSFYHWFYKKNKERSYVMAYLLVIAVWIIETPAWYFAVLFLALLLLQLRMENDLVIALSPAGVVITGLTRRNYEWAAFNNIILRDGLLTLDFTNNRVVQVEPDGAGPASRYPGDAEDYPQTEKEFNEFCREHLKK